MVDGEVKCVLTQVEIDEVRKAGNTVKSENEAVSALRSKGVDSYTRKWGEHGAYPGQGRRIDANGL